MVSATSTGIPLIETLTLCLSGAQPKCVTMQSSADRSSGARLQQYVRVALTANLRGDPFTLRFTKLVCSGNRVPQQIVPCRNTMGDGQQGEQPVHEVNNGYYQ